MVALAQLLNMPAILWAKNGNGANGQPTFATPVQVMCYWQDGHEETVNSQGDTVQSIATAFIDRDVAELDRILLGTLTGGTSANPFTAGAKEVVRFTKRVPALLNVDPVRKIWIGG